MISGGSLGWSRRSARGGAGDLLGHGARCSGAKAGGEHTLRARGTGQFSQCEADDGVLQDKARNEESPVEKLCVIGTQGDRVCGEERGPSCLLGLDTTQSDTTQRGKGEDVARLDRDGYSGGLGKSLLQLLLCSGGAEIQVQAEECSGGNRKKEDRHYKNGLGNRAHRNKLGDQQQL